jgi:L-ascorbate metabolism protein UlaG (beta-lactamase superfamily)
VPGEPGPPPPRRVAKGKLRVTFVNHATVLIQAGAFNLLTDPHWGERCSPVAWAGPRRVRAPGLRLEDLPPLDAVLLSHNHYDHLDRGTLDALGRRHPSARLYTGLGVGAAVPAVWRGRMHEMDWWQSLPLGPQARLHYVPSRHFSARGPFDKWRTRWGGFQAELPGGAVYFAGDTGYGRHFGEIRRRLGAPRLAILPIGAYEPRWFMEHHHMNPVDAVRAFKDLKARYALAMHFGTFQLADEGFDDPLRVLAEASKAARLVAGRFRALGFGAAWQPGR